MHLCTDIGRQCAPLDYLVGVLYPAPPSSRLPPPGESLKNLSICFIGAICGFDSQILGVLHGENATQR